MTTKRGFSSVPRNECAGEAPLSNPEQVEAAVTALRSRLRREFAIVALAQLVPGYFVSSYDDQEYAQIAYDLADAMLLEDEGRPLP